MNCDQDSSSSSIKVDDNDDDNYLNDPTFKDDPTFAASVQVAANADSKLDNAIPEWVSPDRWEMTIKTVETVKMPSSDEQQSKLLEFKYVDCPNCTAIGYDDMYDSKACATCDGTGKDRHYENECGNCRTTLVFPYKCYQLCSDCVVDLN